MKRKTGKAATTKKPVKKVRPVAKTAADVVIKLPCCLCKKKFPGHELRIDKAKNKAYCEDCVEEFDIKACKPRMVKCEVPGCDNMFDIRRFSKFLPGTIKQACPECYNVKFKGLTRRRQSTPDFGWYVIWFSGQGGKVRSKIRKSLKLAGLESQMGRMFQPTHLVEKMLPVYADTVAEGEAKSPNDARADIKIKMDTLEIDNPDVLYKAMGPFQDEKTGKWKWKVRIDTGEKTLRVVKTAKFPGYMLAQFKWDERVKAAVEKVPFCGVLLKPVCALKFKMTVAESKKYGWRWRVKHPNSGLLIATGTVPWTALPVPTKKPRDKKKVFDFNVRVQDAIAQNEDRRLRGKDKAREKVRSIVEQLRGNAAPVSIEAAEAMLILTEQKTVDDIFKNKDELNRPIVHYGVGDWVIIGRGPWTGQRAKVIILDKMIRDSEGVRQPEANVVVMLAPMVGGQTMPSITLSFKHHELT